MRKLLAPYFSIQGRSSRREWWITEILIVFGFRVNEYLFEVMATEGGRLNLGAEAGQTWMILAATLLWLNIASNVRRLHDRGKSGWWSLIYLIPGIGQLWCFIECGFLKGQPHANRYGPPTGAVGVYQSLADQMTARLQPLGAAVPTPTRTPKGAEHPAPMRATPAACRAEPAATTARATRRVSVLAASQRPTVQRGTSRAPMPGGRTLRVAIAVVALLLGLATMALTGGIPMIPTGIAPVGDNSYTGVFRLGGQTEQP